MQKGHLEMHYKIISGQDIFELNPGLRAVDKFGRLTSTQMTYVCLVMDNSNDNPIRTLEGERRREKAAKLAGYSMTESDGKRINKNVREIIDGKVTSINEAIEAYKELHYNEEEGILYSMSSQISQIKIFLDKPNKKASELERSIKLAEKLPDLIKAKKELEQLLNTTVSQKPVLDDVVVLPEPVLEGATEPMSTLDMFMMARQEKDKK